MLTNTHFPAMIKELINKKFFKPINARSGCKSTGLFLLDRSKISSEKNYISSLSKMSNTINETVEKAGKDIN